MTFQIKKLGPADAPHLAALIALFADVFEMPPFAAPEPAYLAELLARPDFLAFVAERDGWLLGGLTGHVLPQTYSRQPLAYVYDLAVRPAHQRQGVGRQLMAAVVAFCREAGMAEVFVQADRVDVHAVAFYRATGATEEDVLHFYYPLTDAPPPTDA